LLSLAVVIYFIFLTIFKYLLQKLKNLFNTKFEEYKNSLVLFFTLSLLQVVVIVFFKFNNLTFYLLPITGFVILACLLLDIWWAILFSVFNAVIGGYLFTENLSELSIFSFYYVLVSLYIISLSEKIFSRQDLFFVILKSIISCFLIAVCVNLLMYYEIDIMFNLNIGLNVFSKEQKLNILITGPTGSGKSSTINALFSKEIAKVGYGVDPETKTIEKYELDNLTLWDSPGLGDGIEEDRIHSRNIIKKLNELDEDGNALIDLVLVILDGSSRDMGTSFQLINNVIIPNMPDKNRILVAINQCDVAMKGENWLEEECKPNGKLEEFLNQKVESVRRRVFESTGVNIEPIYYSAKKYYNMSKLLSFIVRYTPNKKRVVYFDKINPEPRVWERDDKLTDYIGKTKENLLGSFIDAVTEGISAIGSKLVSYVSSAVSSVASFIGGFFGRFF